MVPFIRLILLTLTLILAAGTLTAQDIEVTGIAVCKSVQDRACQEPVETVTADTPSLYCLVTLKSAGAATLKHRWSADGKVRFEIDLSVKFASPLYRQWSQKNLNGVKGNWTVEIVAEDGTVLKSVAFTVE